MPAPCDSWTGDKQRTFHYYLAKNAKDAVMVVADPIAAQVFGYRF
jgi:hypothetical protein